MQEKSLHPLQSVKFVRFQATISNPGKEKQASYIFYVNCIKNKIELMGYLLAIIFGVLIALYVWLIKIIFAAPPKKVIPGRITAILLVFIGLLTLINSDPIVIPLTLFGLAIGSFALFVLPVIRSEEGGSIL